jgi:hypothetical protein
LTPRCEKATSRYIPAVGQSWSESVSRPFICKVSTSWLPVWAVDAKAMVAELLQRGLTWPDLPKQGEFFWIALRDSDGIVGLWSDFF